VGKGRTRRRRPFGWAVVAVGPGTTEPAAVLAGTVRGPKENWVEMQVVASLRGQRVYGQWW
jgi:hypothetical protein